MFVDLHRLGNSTFSMQDKILKLYFKVLTVGLAPAIENAIMCEANCAGGRVIA